MAGKIRVEEIKRDFPIFRIKVHGKPLVYLDSAATSQKPKQVIRAITDYYNSYNANIHRGIYEISEKATERYTQSKAKVAKLINASAMEEIVYVRNTTEAINLVALAWAEQNMKKGDAVLVTEMEHHSNIVPWQLLSRRKGIVLKYAKLNASKDALDIEDFKEKLEAYNPKLVSVTHASNVLGTINDVKLLTKLSHKAGAKVLVDGAQSTPHMPVDVSEIDCDFFAFSGHKMLAPTGIGALYAKREILEATEPMFGGDMIKDVKLQSATWNDLPWKFEAGTANIEGGIGFGAAVDYLENIGMRNVREHEKRLTKYTLNALSDVKGVKVYGPEVKDLEQRGGVISFSVKGIHPHDIASVFDREGIAIRAGHHCAIPLVRGVLGEPALARISFYIYNSEKDVDKAIAAIRKAQKIFNVL
ncbi:MAG: cysteine desulfurase [Candidatus Micrarchaeaceae archaeon]